MNSHSEINVIPFDLEKVPGIDLNDVTSEITTVGKGVDAEQVLVYRTKSSDSIAQDAASIGDEHQFRGTFASTDANRGKLARNDGTSLPCPRNDVQADANTALSDPAKPASSDAGASVGTPFLVLRKNTLELRSDRKLQQLLREKYESVMESRYFGRGGLEIVNSGQLSESDLIDLVRLSYDLSRK